MKSKYSFVILIIAACIIPISISALNKCGANSTPKSIEDCQSGSDDSNYCCFILSPGYDPIIKECVYFEKSKYHGQREYIEKLQVGGNFYRMDCGDIEVKPKKGELCGNDIITNPADCWAFSTQDNSCCSTFEKDKCMWYKKKAGNITDDESIGLLLCSSNTIQLKITSITMLIIMFIFI